MDGPSMCQLQYAPNGVIKYIQFFAQSRLNLWFSRICNMRSLVYFIFLAYVGGYMLLSPYLVIHTILFLEKHKTWHLRTVSIESVPNSYVLTHLLHWKPHSHQLGWIIMFYKFFWIWQVVERRWWSLQFFARRQLWYIITFVFTLARQDFANGCLF